MSEKKKKESSSKSKKDKKPSKSKEPEKGKKGAKAAKSGAATSTQQGGTLLCIHHGEAFTHFCESCNEPICSQCSTLGPHNNQLHRINTLSGAYDPRRYKLSLQINQCLLQKKNKLLAQMQRIEYRLEEIHYIKEIIERDIRLEYGGMLQRLESAEGAKVALLQHEMQEIQQDLNQINDLGNWFTKEVENQMTFLLQSKQIEEKISYLVNKPFKVEVDVYPYDLPRELTKRRERIKELEKGEQVNEMLESVIWELLKNEKEKENELDEWSRLNEKYKQEIIRMRMVCYYCGQVLDESNVNQPCLKNNPEINSNFQGFTEIQPDQQHFATGKHFFARVKYEENLENQKDISQQQQSLQQLQQQQLMQQQYLLQQQQQQQQQDPYHGGSFLYSQQKAPQFQQFPTALQSF